MAKYNTTAKINVEVNGKQAAEMLDSLRKKGVDLNTELNKAIDAGDKVSIRRLRKEIAENDRLIRQLTSDTKQVSDAMSRLDKASLKDLKKTLSSLQRSFRTMERGTKDWEEQAAKIRLVKAEIDKVNASMRTVETAGGRFRNFIERQITGIAVFAGHVIHAFDKVKDLVDKYASMQAEEANVSKYTGMSDPEVGALNSEFKKLDTRTSREELNKLAQEAGRLGKNSVKDVLGFVKAADQINVSLDDLGEGATLTLSKLTNIFGIEDELGTERSLLAVGSVINELSQNSTAGAGYLAEFSKRMAGVGAQAHLTIQQIMAYAAVLDAQGQNVEAASSALSQLIMKMYKDPAAMAKAAKMDVKSFSEVVKRDANEALMMLLENLHKFGGIESLASVFGDMKTDGVRMSAMLASLAGNVETVRWQQENANKAFSEATSITKEFQVQNNTLQARLDKSRKRIVEITLDLGQRLAPVMELTLNTTAGLMKLLQTSAGFIYEYKGALIGAAGGYAIYRTAALAAVAGEKLIAVESAISSRYLKIKTAAVWLYNSALGKATFAMKRAAVANRELNASMVKTAWGALIVIIGLVVGALVEYARKCSEAIKKEKELAEARRQFQKEASDISNESVEKYSREIIQLRSLYSAAIDEAKSKETRISAAKKLISLYPDQFGNMTTEQIMLGKAKGAYDDLTAAIINNAKAKAAADKVLENEKKILELEEELESNRTEYKSAAAEKEKIDRRNRAVDARARTAASTVTGAIAMSEGGSQELYRRESTEEVSKRLSEAAASMRSNKRDLADLRAATDKLTKRFSGNESFRKQLDTGLAGTEDDEAGMPSTEPGLSDKERKKLEAEAKRAAIKAKKEFKEALKSIQAQKDMEIAGLMQQRAVGDLDYKEYTEEKYKVEKKFYDDSIALYDKWKLQEDADCAALIKKREEHEAEYNRERFALDLDVIKRTAQAEEQEVNMRYAFRKNKTVADELQLQEELLAIRYNALLDEQTLYEKGSKEYEDTERRLQDLLFSDMEAKKKLLSTKANEFQQKFDKLSVKEKYDLELNALETLYERKYIKEDEYQRWKSALERSQKKDTREEKSKLPGSTPETSASKAKTARTNFDDRRAELKEALDKGVIDEKEYKARLGRIRAEMNASLVDPLRAAQSEWVSMLTNAYQAWADFAQALKDPESDPFSAMANGISATASIVNAVMSQITEFSKAQYEIQAAAVQKRYDKELQYAEGNAYLTKKLEKERQKELDQLKAEQSKKNFQLQVISTIAQTAANAVQAYSAGLSIGGPAGLIMAPVAAALAVAQGAVQIALLKKQQQAAASIGYSEGGFTRPGHKDDPAGIVHAGEWVASQKLVNSPKTRPLIDMLEYAQRNNRIGSISMDDVSRSVAAPMFNAYSQQSQQPVIIYQNQPGDSSRQDPELGRALTRLADRLDDPFVTVNYVSGPNGYEEAKRKYQRMIRNKSRKVRS